jgi:hypothetical protein
MLRTIALGGVLALVPAMALELRGHPSPQSQTPSAQSQNQGMDENIQLLREDIRSKKKQLIAANLKLTDDEATKFWPIYDRYTGELVAINNDKYAAIKEYADTWGTMTDTQALALTKKVLGVDQDFANLRVKYVAEFGKAMPSKKSRPFIRLNAGSKPSSTCNWHRNCPWSRLRANRLLRKMALDIFSWNERPSTCRRVALELIPEMTKKGSKMDELCPNRATPD